MEFKESPSLAGTLCVSVSIAGHRQRKKETNALAHCLGGRDDVFGS